MSGDEKEDEDLDGVPLDGAALLKSALMRGIPGGSIGPSSSHSPLRNEPQSVRMMDNSQDESDYDDDIDGIPCK